MTGPPEASREGKQIHLFCTDHWAPVPDEPGINGIALNIMMAQRGLGDMEWFQETNAGISKPYCCWLGESEMRVMYHAAKNKNLATLAPGRLDEPGNFTAYLEAVREDLND